MYKEFVSILKIFVEIQFSKIFVISQMRIYVA